jgi:hypothetical protein
VSPQRPRCDNGRRNRHDAERTRIARGLHAVRPLFLGLLQARLPAPKRPDELVLCPVGRSGIEPLTSCLSSKRSPAELTPRGRASYPRPPPRRFPSKTSLCDAAEGNVGLSWRRRAESNRCAGLCRPLPKPLGHAASVSSGRRITPPAGRPTSSVYRSLISGRRRPRLDHRARHSSP